MTSWSPVRQSIWRQSFETSFSSSPTLSKKTGEWLYRQEFSAKSNIWEWGLVGGFQALPAYIRLAWPFLPKTSTLAYSSRLSATKKKSIMTLTPRRRSMRRRRWSSWRACRCSSESCNNSAKSFTDIFAIILGKVSWNCKWTQGILEGDVCWGCDPCFAFLSFHA